MPERTIHLSATRGLQLQLRSLDVLHKTGALLGKPMGADKVTRNQVRIYERALKRISDVALRESDHYHASFVKAANAAIQTMNQLAPPPKAQQAVDSYARQNIVLMQLRADYWHDPIYQLDAKTLRQKKSVPLTKFTSWQESTPSSGRRLLGPSAPRASCVPLRTTP